MMSSMNEFTQLCDKYNFKGFSFPSIQVKQNANGIWKKDIKWGDVQWQKNPTNQIKQGHQGYAIRTGEVSNITVIDCDSEEVYNQIISDFPLLKNTFRVKTNKGYHLYLKYNSVFNTRSNSFNKYPGIDIRNNGGIVFAPPTEYFHEGLKSMVGYQQNNTCDIQPIPKELVDLYISQTKQTTTKKTIKPKENNIISTNSVATIIESENIYIHNIEEIEDISNNISIKYLDNYDDWLYIIIALYTIGTEKAKQIALNISKKSTKFDNLDKWESGELKKFTQITLGTLYHYSKISNEDNHIAILVKHFNYKKYKISDLEGDMAQKCIELFGKDFIFEKGELFHFNGVYWQQDTSEHHVPRKIMADLSNYYGYLSKNLNLKRTAMSDDNSLSSKQMEEKLNEIDTYIKIVKNCLKYCKTNTRIKNIIALFKNLLEKDQAISWENKPYYYVFNNKIYDLQSQSFVEPLQSDNLFISCGYDYKYGFEEHLQKINEIVADIFPDKEQREYYLYICASMMIGRTLPKFVIANGGGSNGKSMFHELIMEMLGNYGYLLNNESLTNKTNNSSSPNPQLANCKFKRGVIAREPEKNRCFNTSVIKELTGGKGINTRVCNSNDTQIETCMTLVVETNNLLKFGDEGAIDYAMRRRAAPVSFSSMFVSPEDYEEYKEDPKVKKGNTYYMTKEFRDTYKYALFELLCPYAKRLIEKDFNIDAFRPQSVLEQTNEYLQTNDRFVQYFMQSFQRTDDNTNFIKLNDIYSEHFIYSNFHQALSRKEKADWSKKVFINAIKDNVMLRKDYKEQHFYEENNERKKLRNVLVRWTMKNNDDDE